MKLMIILFLLGILFEGLAHLDVLKGIRKLLVIIDVPLIAVSIGMLFAWHVNTASVLVFILGLYRIFNVVRVVKGRMHEQYLRFATLRTSAILVIMQAILLGVWWIWHLHAHERRILWLALSILQAFVAIVFLASTTRRLKRTMPEAPMKHYSDASLPSISIAIPARNETVDLEECLASIIASDYPKFEVLVLDDCSQNKRTPEIIRSFAHDGVRFLQGEEPRLTWLAKNQAYDQLAREASGDFILFCGADIRFERDSIRKLVAEMLERKKQMVSILPKHRTDMTGRFSLIQAMRYWWELVPPRRLFNRPAVLSACWIIDAKALLHAGGFAAVTRSIVPEAYFAKQLTPHDTYSFIRSDDILGIDSVKQPIDQQQTAIRMRYPQVHRRPELVYLVALFEFTFLILPFVIAAVGWWLPLEPATRYIAVLSGLLLIASYEEVAVSTGVNHWLFAIIALPIVTIVDIFQIHRSMWQYEFSDVIWKGRNVCVPVMHTYPHLPTMRQDQQRARH